MVSKVYLVVQRWAMLVQQGLHIIRLQQTLIANSSDGCRQIAHSSGGASTAAARLVVGRAATAAVPLPVLPDMSMSSLSVTLIVASSVRSVQLNPEPVLVWSAMTAEDELGAPWRRVSICIAVATLLAFLVAMSPMSLCIDRTVASVAKSNEERQNK